MAFGIWRNIIQKRQELKVEAEDCHSIVFACIRLPPAKQLKRIFYI